MDAIKLPQHSINSRDQIDVLLHEARAAAQLNHPNIVRVISVGDWAGRPYIVFEFIEGVTLKQRIKDNERDPRPAVDLIIKLADAIDHAHKLKIVHRDLKPGNILIDDSGEPHITDFGLAKRLDVHSTIATDGTIMGTVPYMSPEQVTADHNNIEPASDVYALGVILYELLTGVLPFQGSRLTITNDIQFKDPPPLRRHDSTIPRDLETICLKTLQKEPASRYRSAAELRDDLQRMLDGKRIRARRVSLPGRAVRWIRHHPLQFMIRASGTVLMLSTTGLLVSDFFVDEQSPINGNSGAGATSTARRKTDPADDVGRRNDTNETHSGRQLGSASQPTTGLSSDPSFSEDSRLVDIKSFPAGAELVIHKIDPETDKVLHGERAVIRPTQLTPLRCRLEPGTYRVIATKDGLARELRPTVPKRPAGSPVNRPVVWPEIVIPEALAE